MKESNFSRLFDESDIEEINCVNVELDEDNESNKNKTVTDTKNSKVNDEDVKYEV